MRLLSSECKIFNYIWICICMYAKLLQLCPTLCNPLDCSQPVSYVHWISQAKILEWVAMPSSRGSSWLRDQTLISYVSCIVTLVLYLIICCPYLKFNCPISFHYSCLWISAFYVTKSWHPCPICDLNSLPRPVPESPPFPDLYPYTYMSTISFTALSLISVARATSANPCFVVKAFSSRIRIYFSLSLWSKA